jgi:hypothetical protein
MLERRGERGEGRGDKPNHMDNSIQPAVAPFNKVGKKKETPKNSPNTL